MNSRKTTDRAMHNIFKKAAIAAALVGTVSVAQAGFVTVDNVKGQYVANTIPIVPSNNFRDYFPGMNYTLGTSLATDLAGTVDFYYGGKEAGYDNVFNAYGANGTSVTKDSGFSPTYQDFILNPKSIGSIDVTGGLLQFTFCAFAGSDGAKIGVGCINNAQNDMTYLGSTQSMAFAVSGNTAWIFWDDSGAGPDDNHDDMIIKAVFRPRSVPEPATLGLFGLAMLGTWFATRRRKSASVA